MAEHEQQLIRRLSQEFGVKEEHAAAVVELLDEGNTVPFIARYRKERHGTMDDQTIRGLSERLTYLRNLNTRKEEVRLIIEEQGKLNEKLSLAISAAETLAQVEDLYRPYRPKRRTRASVAREKGLEPLAMCLLSGKGEGRDPLALARDYVDPEKGVETK